MAALEHHVIVDPPKHHLPSVVGKAFFQQVERPDAWEGKFTRQGLYFVVKVEKGPLLVTRYHQSGGVAIKFRQRWLAVDFPHQVFFKDVSLIMGHGPGLGSRHIRCVADHIDVFEAFSF